MEYDGLWIEWWFDGIYNHVYHILPYFTIQSAMFTYILPYVLPYFTIFYHILPIVCLYFTKILSILYHILSIFYHMSPIFLHVPLAKAIISIPIQKVRGAVGSGCRSPSGRQISWPRHIWRALKSWIIWNNLSIWVNYNISLTWIKAILGWFPLLTMIPVRSQWGRYNLPR